mmetsp:Transcript_69754/g.110868  ORF Transcript_69754/g.110868 Transcript_69754/m.110868 type:complete len:361 (-) Transcript_69754:1036-2118(-)
MATSVGYGIAFAIASLLCNGSFSALNKLPSVVQSKVDAQIFNFYFIIGAVVSSLVVYVIYLGLGENVEVTYLGVISGFLLSLAGICTFACIRQIGLSVGVAIWSGTAVLVSFIEGLLVDSQLYSWPMSVIGIIILLIGICVVSFSELLASVCCNADEQSIKYLPPSSGGAYQHAEDGQLEAQNLLSAEQETLKHAAIESYDEEMTATKWFLGVFYGILAGILGGSIGFPYIFTDDNNHDGKYLISFAIGASFIFIITPLLQCVCRENPNEQIRWEFKICFIPGCLAGIIWNCGNLASLYAIEILGYSVAYPIMQSALIIASVWGICVFKEYSNKHVIACIFLGAITVICGCVLITYGIDG